MSDLYLELRTRIPVVTSWVQVGKERLQEAQDATGLSNERLARQIPISSKTWERWKKRGEIPADSLPAVARVLDIEVRRTPPTVIDLDPGGNGKPGGEERWQREMRDEMRRGFQKIETVLGRIEQAQRDSSARSRSSG